MSTAQTLEPRNPRLCRQQVFQSLTVLTQSGSRSSPFYPPWHKKLPWMRARCSSAQSELVAAAGLAEVPHIIRRYGGPRILRRLPRCSRPRAHYPSRVDHPRRRHSRFARASLRSDAAAPHLVMLDGDGNPSSQLRLLLAFHCTA